MPYSKWLLNTLNLCLLLLSCQVAKAAEQESPEAAGNPRPKIGLVLSGGGARGFAHIGVLKVLEENNIPVDFVVGTSMGSIVGGLYAIGLTPEDIEFGVTGIDWDRVFIDFAKRYQKRFRRKQDDYDFYGIKRLGFVDNRIVIPPGIIEGQQIELALDRLAYPGFNVRDFDKLSIPYRAVATNLENGKPFIIDHGNIARAMRASMSIPGALPPITIDGTLLVDGGIANNIPIGVARNMGAEVVIVVDVSAPLLKKEDIKSGLDVTGQLTTIMTRRIADEQLKSLGKQDVLIVPGEREITSSDFNKYPELIKAGQVSAMEQLASLKRYSLSDEDYASYKQSLPKIADRNPIIDFIEIHNNTILRDGIIKVRISQKTGEPLDVLQLEDDLSAIYGLDYASSVVYSVEKRDGKTGLFIYVRDRKWAREYLEFGLSIETSFEIQSITNLYASFTSTINSLAGEIRAIAALGSEPEIELEYFQPLTLKLDYYFSGKRGYDTRIFPILDDKVVLGVERINRDYYILAVGKTFMQTTDLRFGFHDASGSISSISGVEANRPDFDENYLFVRLRHDSLNSFGVPTSGMYANLEYIANRESLGSDLDLDQIKLALAVAGTYKRYTVLSRLIAETTLNDNKQLPNINNLFLHGGFLELSGTVRNELLGQHFGMLQAVFSRKLGESSLLPTYGGFSLEAGNAWLESGDIKRDNIRYAGSLFLSVDTFLGPIYLAVGATDKGENAFYFNLGNNFLLRNN
ncbi:MAG TPA: hypothetical protein ENJ11_01550 [Gammaproteobacteria bacterium]|nr:hypothetical protein [Gammaproteobacteria bacterium]